jgi:hypothetical protein
MKLHLILVASLFNLSSGFMVELKGPLNEEACSGEESDDFIDCVALGAALDPKLALLADLLENGFMNFGGERKLSWCAGCKGIEPRGTFCFTMCNQNRRLDTPNLRRVQAADSAVFKDGVYTPENGEAQQVAEHIIECLSDEYACLGDPVDMTLTVTL